MTIVLTTTISSAVARTGIIMIAFCILGTLKYFVMYKEGIQFVFFFYRSIVQLCDVCIYVSERMFYKYTKKKAQLMHFICPETSYDFLRHARIAKLRRKWTTSNEKKKISIFKKIQSRLKNCSIEASCSQSILHSWISFDILQIFTQVKKILNFFLSFFLV